MQVATQRAIHIQASLPQAHLRATGKFCCPVSELPSRRRGAFAPSVLQRSSELLGMEQIRSSAPLCPRQSHREWEEAASVKSLTSLPARAAPVGWLAVGGRGFLSVATDIFLWFRKWKNISGFLSDNKADLSLNSADFKKNPPCCCLTLSVVSASQMSCISYRS